jgi:hypothetical protein
MIFDIIKLKDCDLIVPVISHMAGGYALFVSGTNSKHSFTNSTIVAYGTTITAIGSSAGSAGAGNAEMGLFIFRYNGAETYKVIGTCHNYIYSTDVVSAISVLNTQAIGYGASNATEAIFSSSTGSKEYTYSNGIVVESTTLLNKSQVATGNSTEIILLGSNILSLYNYSNKTIASGIVFANLSESAVTGNKEIAIFVGGIEIHLYSQKPPDYEYFYYSTGYGSSYPSSRAYVTSSKWRIYNYSNNTIKAGTETTETLRMSGSGSCNGYTAFICYGEHYINRRDYRGASGGIKFNLNAGTTNGASYAGVVSQHSAFGKYHPTYRNRGATSSVPGGL